MLKFSHYLWGFWAFKTFLQRPNFDWNDKKSLVFCFALEYLELCAIQMKWVS